MTVTREMHNRCLELCRVLKNRYPEAYAMISGHNVMVVDDAARPLPQFVRPVKDAVIVTRGSTVADLYEDLAALDEVATGWAAQLCPSRKALDRVEAVITRELEMGENAFDKICDMTGATTTASARAIHALKSLGYFLQDERKYAAGDRPRPEGYLWQRLSVLVYEVRASGKSIGYAETKNGAWTIAAAHALAHRAKDLPPAGTTWKMPGE